VIQYHDSSGVDHDLGIASKVSTPHSPHAILGELGGALSIGFDLVSAFGYHFAVQLTRKLSETSAEIVADAILVASSGERVRFENTDTFRYRERDSSDTDLSYGVVREITSGLVVDLTGVVTGNGSIDVNALVSLSKRGADLSGQGNPPPTSERMIATRTSVEPGKVALLGRFVFQEESSSSDGSPLLGRIPVVSNLLGSSRHRTETAELVIYLIPHIDASATRVPAEQEMQRLYETYIRG
jgi:type II secretory pathway component HofQ